MILLSNIKYKKVLSEYF